MVQRYKTKIKNEEINNIEKMRKWTKIPLKMEEKF